MSDMVRQAGIRTVLVAALTIAGSVMIAGEAGAIPTPCADPGPTGTLKPECFKEVRLINNTDRPIYPVLQGSIIKQAAIGCAIGDVWLQRALGVTNKCLPVSKDYYIYVNPMRGILAGETVSVSLPWWSKRTAGAPDEYIDWWRSGRLYIFDDAKAKNEIFDKVRGTPRLKLAAGSPAPACKAGAANKACATVAVWQVPDGGDVGTQRPVQLNEYTFASVGAASDKFTLFNLNQNYNVSNVDQTYLPLAMEPIRPKPDIGYMGTTIPLDSFRMNLRQFTQVDPTGKTPPDHWPVYNNPVVNGARVYPNGGIRVPSAETVFNFYMNPYFFGGDLAKEKIPQILPYDPGNPQPPAAVTAMMARWDDCTRATPVNCPTSGKVDWSTYYKTLKTTFIGNYNKYLDYIAAGKCRPAPAFLRPLAGSNPRVPANKYVLLRYIYGWVPFNAGCDADVLPSLDLPTVDKGNKLPISYVQQQYDFTVKYGPANAPKLLPIAEAFNPYTAMVHNAVADKNLPGIASNAYAFSIDDMTAFQTNSGSGLIFAVGGAKGLPNRTKVLPTVPPPYQKWDVGIFVAAQGTSNTRWARYGICSAVANMQFPTVPNDTGFAIGVDPAVSNFPCDVTLQDSAGVTYRFTLSAKTQTPPKPIWPAWPVNKPGFDTTVVSCKTSSSKPWCQFVNETAIAAGQTSGPMYSLTGRGPLPN